MSDMVNFKEVAISFEHFVQITVTELSNKVNFIEVLKILWFRDDNIYELDDVGMLTIFQQDELS